MKTTYRVFPFNGFHGYMISHGEQIVEVGEAQGGVKYAEELAKKRRELWLKAYAVQRKIGIASKQKPIENDYHPDLGDSCGALRHWDE